MDKSIDVVGLTVLLLLFQYPRQLTMEEGLLLSESLATNTSAAQLLKVLNNFFNLMIYPETTMLVSALVVGKMLALLA